MCCVDPYGLLAERHKYPNSQRYRRVLEALMTPLQAQIVAELPAHPQEIAEKLGLSEASVLRELEWLFQRGVVSVKDIPSRKGFRFWNDVGLLWTYTLSLLKLKGFNGEVLKRWGDFVEQEWYPRLAQEYARNPQPFDRVLPAYRSVAGVAGLHPSEDIRELLRAQELIATHPCACRTQAQRCHTPVDTCFLFGWAAEYGLARDAAQRLSYDEALSCLDRAADHSQVHIWMNSTFVYARYMCNCCRCCCVIINPPLRYGIPLEKRLAPSRFQAVLTAPERCYSCRDKPCIPSCQFEALQKLTTAGAGEGLVVREEKCWGCGFCVLKCPVESLAMKVVRPLQHIPGLAPAA